MAPTDDFKAQSNDLVRALSRIAIKLRIGSDHNGAIVRAELIEIARKLVEHRKMEAELLAAGPTSYRNPLDGHVARSTLRELSLADERIDRFLQAWSTAQGIDDLHEEFVEDALRLVQALRMLLRREAEQLMPIVERSTAEPAARRHRHR